MISEQEVRDERITALSSFRLEDLAIGESIQLYNTAVCMTRTAEGLSTHCEVFSVCGPPRINGRTHAESEAEVARLTAALRCTKYAPPNVWTRIRRWFG